MLRADERADEPLDLRRVAEVVRVAKMAGLSVTLDLAAPERIPSEIARATVRVVQEATTYVLRHADATELLIPVAPEEQSLLVLVEDDERGGEATPGHGIMGMHERTRALGGEFVAEPGTRGGFRVTARLSRRGGEMV